MSEELKPCPFCGGEAIVKGSDKMLIWWVDCKTSQCHASDNADTLSREAAIAAWNRRPQ